MAFSTIPEPFQNVECSDKGISVSADGYIRLTDESIFGLAYSHLLSGLDEEVTDFAGEGAVSSEISGYTEWVSQTVPVITLGWDWFLACTNGEPHLLRVGKPSSNVMAIDCKGQNLGYDATLNLLCSLVDTMDWQSVVIRHIKQRYAASL